MNHVLKHLATLWLIFSLSHTFAQTIYQGNEASLRIKDAQTIRYRSESPFPNYVQFRVPQNVPQGDLLAFARNILDLPPGYDLVLDQTDYDALGYMHLRFQQQVHGIPVDGSSYILHYKMGEGLESMNGYIYPISDLNVSPSISESAALQTSLQWIGAERYKWEVLAEEKAMENQGLSWYPNGRLVLAPNQGNYSHADFRLAWRFDVYAHEPHSRSWQYIDAHTGMHLFQIDRIHTADASGTAVTKYSGTQSITTDSFVGGFRLREAARGNGIETYNMQNGNNFANAVDFTDSDNFWNNVNAQQDEAATDAHWGAEETYDYFFNTFGLNSLDGNGFKIISYVHYGNNFVNAFWNGAYIVLGDGNATVTPLTTLDVIGHELTHGITEFSSGLIYSYESGALNESFSDIFGAVVENYARPGNSNWTIGEDMNFTIRDMSNPNAYGDPDTYLGTNWFTGAGDNGGVHTNSGVQNHWFYLLSDGGSGTNDIGNPFTVTGIGITDAARVAYRNNVIYLTPSSDYADARFYGIQAAVDLFGGCSDEVIATTDAWYAVGVGASYTPGIITSDFQADITTLCSYPGTVSFNNQTTNGGTYMWDFGDGNTSTQDNPTHNYLTPGTYSVTLTATSNCGTDTEVKSGYIDVLTPPSTPSVVGASGGCKSTLNLSASGTGNILWFNDQNQLLEIGNSYTTGVLNQTATYYAVNAEPDSTYMLPPLDASFSASAYHNLNGDEYLTFTVKRDLIINSVWVDAGATGDRVIYLWDNNGTLLHTFSVNIPFGTSRVNFNLPLSPGNYRIGGNKMNLRANFNSAAYPYTSDLLDITGCSSTIFPDAFFYFYDWEVTEYCFSESVPVIAQITGIDPPLALDGNTCGPGTVDLSATVLTGTINWYDDNFNFIQTGSSYTTPLISTTTTYYVEAEQSFASLYTGPVDNSFGAGTYNSFGQPNYLEFTALEQVFLEQVDAYANSSGNRTIQIWDGTGVLLHSIPASLTNGLNTVDINVQLDAGDYRIGGVQMDLFVNTSGVSYPYTGSSLVNITGSSTGSNDYYFFYNWKLRPSSCFSNYATVNAVVGVGSQPTALFNFSPVFGTITFTDQSSIPDSWLWDFGDGNTSVLQNPVHTYATSGTYTVTLTVYNGTCEDTFTETITVTTLPVSYLSFEAVAVGNTALLNWTTSREEQNAGFYVEMAKDQSGQSFEKVGFVEGSGNSETAIDYDFSVPGLSSGTYQFRLRQIDINGLSHLSEVKSLHIQSEQLALGLFPNPAQDILHLSMTIPFESEVKVQWLDSRGRELALNQAFNLDAGTHEIKQDVSGLSSGLYLIKVSNGKQHLMKKVLIQH